MIVRNIIVENFRGFRGSAAVDLATGSPIIIEGPNGSGKSTLAEAITRVLADRHDMGGESAERLRPRGTDLTPRMTLEFEHAGVQYRLAKQFLDAPSALLEKCGAGGWEPVAKGKTADQRVREMLRSEAAKGTADPKDMGLLGVLCTPQGGLPLPLLSGAFLEDVREMLGAQMAGPRGIAFEKLVRKKYESGWTPGRKLKKGRITEVQAALVEARKEFEECSRRLQTVADLEARARTSGDQQKALQTTIDGLVSQLAVAERLEKQASECANRRALAQVRLQAADADYRHLGSLVDQINEASKTKTSLEVTAPPLAGDLRSAAEDLTAAQGGERAVRDEWERSVAPDPDLASSVRRLELAAELRELEAKIGPLSRRHGRIVELATQVNQIENQISNLRAPDKAGWRAIQARAQERSEALLRLDSLALRLDIAAEADLVAEVEVGNPVGRTNFVVGQELTVSGDGELSVRLPGIAFLRVSGPTSDVSEWRRKLQAAEAGLAELIKPFNTADLAELGRRFDEATDLRRNLEGLQVERRALLDGDSADTLEARLKALALRQSEILQERPDWESAAPEPAALKKDVDVRRSEREGWQQSARLVWQQAEERRAEAQAKVVEAQQRQAANDAALSEVQRRLAALQTDGKTLTARQVELAGHRRACESAEEEIRGVDEEIGRLPADALQRAEGLRLQIAQYENDASAAREDLRQAEADARALRAQAPYSSLVLAEERVDQLVADERAELARLNAIQLLFQAVSDAKATVLEGLAVPVAATANLILERIVGGPLARIQLADDCELHALRPEGVDDEAEIEEMSGGEQEQIWFSTRLALADLLVRGEPQAVVLDDVFEKTDPARLGRILDLLKERASRMQFIILTCHPDRYLPLVEAGGRSIHMERFQVRP